MDKKKREMEENNPVITAFSGLLKLILMAVLLLVLIFIGKYAYHLGYTVFHETPIDTGKGREVTVTIDPGMSVYTIGKVIQEEGVLAEEPLTFLLQERISSYHGKLQPGTYRLRTSMVSNDVFKALSEGSVTPEGQE